MCTKSQCNTRYDSSIAGYYLERRSIYQPCLDTQANINEPYSAVMPKQNATQPIPSVYFLKTPVMPLFYDFTLRIIITVDRLGRSLGTVQPLDMPQSPARLTLLHLRPRQLLLLPRAELHIIIAALLGCASTTTLRLALYRTARLAGRRGRECAVLARRHARRQARRDTADAGRRGTAHGAVFETSAINGEMALVREATFFDVPLLGAECAHEFFIVRDHDHTSLPVADGDG